MDVEIFNEVEDSAEDGGLELSSQSAPIPFDDDDGSTCPVCLESWTNCGDHRICCLKCGHLFGYKCIVRWLDSQTKKSCPTCKLPVRKSDLRFIYAKKLIAIDSIELESMREQLENALMQKNIALQSVSKYISREQVLQSEIEQLRKKVQELTLGANRSDFRMSVQCPINRVRLYMEKTIEVCNKNSCRDCRVFDISESKNIILIASRSSTDLFGGFGLKKLSLSNYKQVKFIPLHKGPIRDMCLHPIDNKVLTVSADRKFKIIDTDNTQTIFTVNMESAPWSCSWNPKKSDELLVGTQNGTVNIFDIRNLNGPVHSLNIPGDFNPVVSVATVNEPLCPDVVLVAKLTTAWAFECNSDGTFNRYLLPLEGPFLSMTYEEKSKQMLVSSRPNSQINFARHTVAYLERTSEPDTISCNIVHAFKGGCTAKLLAKTSCFLPNNIVAGHHETRKSILLYSINTGEEVGSCPTHDNLVLDMKGLDTASGKFLVYLNEKKIEFFKFNVS
uniref:RING-type E3 ubiquitin transferase n=4 Tax=Dendroctonus ponderosae TaxID=77166 RepID=A0AAR5Q5D7_DENPD